MKNRPTKIDKWGGDRIYELEDLYFFNEFENLHFLLRSPGRNSTYLPAQLHFS